MYELLKCFLHHAVSAKITASRQKYTRKRIRKFVSKNSFQSINQFVDGAVTYTQDDDSEAQTHKLVEQ